MTEEGFPHAVSMPELQALGNTTDLSDLPVMDKQQALAEMTALFNSPALQPLFAQFPDAIEQALQAANQSGNLMPGEDPEDSGEDLKTVLYNGPECA